MTMRCVSADHEAFAISFVSPLSSSLSLWLNILTQMIHRYCNLSSGSSLAIELIACLPASHWQVNATIIEWNASAKSEVMSLCVCSARNLRRRRTGEKKMIERMSRARSQSSVWLRCAMCKKRILLGGTVCMQPSVIHSTIWVFSIYIAHLLLEMYSREESSLKQKRRSRNGVLFEFLARLTSSSLFDLMSWCEGWCARFAANIYMVRGALLLLLSLSSSKSFLFLWQLLNDLLHRGNKQWLTEWIEFYLTALGKCSVLISLSLLDSNVTGGAQGKVQCFMLDNTYYILVRCTASSLSHTHKSFLWQL